MICPRCKHRLTVLDTRPNYQGKPEIYRKMECKNCGEWYFSEEKIKSMANDEFRNNWENSERWKVRKEKLIIQNVSDVGEN